VAAERKRYRAEVRGGDRSWPASLEKIEAYVGPPELGAADDLEQVIVEFIAGAKTRLDIAVQEIDSRAIAQAILDARWRGVRVTIFLEQDYLRSDLAGNPPKPPTPRAGETAAEALRRVQWARPSRRLYRASMAGTEAAPPGRCANTDRSLGTA
jgi:phosphatidylserine/phosphatidylglycerophosphate/cardiolipin synthase-like enzyme